MLPLPLDPAETLEPNEAEMTEEILLAMRKVAGDRDAPGRGRRGAHTGSHGTLEATVIVPEGLDSALRVGLFATPGTFRAWLRTSSASDSPTADSVPNLRGLGLKVLGVPGDRLVPDPENGLDILFISAEIVPFGTVKSFWELMVDVLRGTANAWLLGEQGKRSKITAQTVSGSDDLLGLTFFSTTPYRLGELLVKFRLQPTGEASWSPADRLVSGPPPDPTVDANLTGRGPIRETMVRRLGKGGVAFTLAVLRQTDAAAQPVEDASVAWSAAGGAWETVARIEVPAQTFDTPERDAWGESLRIDPWHVPAAQRPLGGLNRVRGAVYHAMAAERSATANRAFTPPVVTERSPKDPRPVCLREADWDRPARDGEVSHAREEVGEDPEKLPSFLMCKGAPSLGRPRLGWSLTAGRLSLSIAANVLANKRAAAGAEAEGPVAEAAAAVEAAAAARFAAELDAAEARLGTPEAERALPDDRLRAIVANKVDGVFTGAMGAGLNLFESDSIFYLYRSPGPSPKPSSVAEVEALFRRLPLTPAAEGLRDDVVFARRRLVGPNAPFLRRDVEGSAYGFADAHVAAATGDRSVAECAAAGRLFVCDYAPLADLAQCKPPSRGTAMYAAAPTLVLGVPRGGGAPRPIAIRTAPGRDGRVVAPGQDWAWELGKHLVEVADIGWFEPITHLGHTHLLLEPVGLATLRNLPMNHPIARLLLSHTEGTLSVNDMAVNHLLADNGAIDQTFAATMESIRRIAVDTAIAHDVRRDGLLGVIARQGLDDRSALPVHPWRDDALRLHGAIGRWIDGYVRRVYPDDATLHRDTELAAWGTALGRPGGQGGLTGFGRLDRREDLIAVLTELVFTASAGHAAVNFPQWTDAAFPARMPGAAYAPMPASGGTESDWLAMLPPLDKAELQSEFLYLLGALYYTRLGKYDAIEGGTFTDPVVTGELLPAFQAELLTIEAEIEHDNAEVRDVPYTHLLPSKVPQSINV